MASNRNNFIGDTRKWSFWKLTGVAVFMTFAFSATAFADLEFRVTWLTDPSGPANLGFTPDPDLHGSMGINNLGQVVYGYAPPSASIRPFLWLPDADFGLLYPG